MTKLVLLPGLDGTGALFDEFIAALPRSIEPIVIGYPAEESSYEVLRLLIESQLPKGPFAILAESFSGPLAIQLAARCNRITAVILCATFVTLPVPIPAWFAWPLWFRLIPRFVMARVLSGRWSAPKLERAIAAASPRVIAARIRSVLRVDVRDALRAIDVPVLQLVGARDLLVRSKIANVKTIVIDAPHLVLQEAPIEAANTVAEFLP